MKHLIDFLYATGSLNEMFPIAVVEIIDVIIKSYVTLLLSAPIRNIFIRRPAILPKSNEWQRINNKTLPFPIARPYYNAVRTYDLISP